MRIDLHTHSNCSDGTDTPAQLIENAVSKGRLDVVALSDHDSYAGWDEAAAAAERVGIEFVPGVEISTKLKGVSVHLLGYWPDPANTELNKVLAEIREGREKRLERIVTALNAAGVDISLEDVQAEVHGAAPGRPHVADALVAKGIVADRRRAFDEYLAEHRPGYVPHPAPTPQRGTELVRGAGGVPVLAHAWSRSSREVLTADVLAELKHIGLAGLEVDHQDHDAATQTELGRIADELGLIPTGSSDYHGLGKVDHDLGSHVTAESSYERLKAERG